METYRLLIHTPPRSWPDADDHSSCPPLASPLFAPEQQRSAAPCRPNYSLALFARGSISLPRRDRLEADSSALEAQGPCVVRIERCVHTWFSRKGRAHPHPHRLFGGWQGPSRLERKTTRSAGGGRVRLPHLWALAGARGFSCIQSCLRRYLCVCVGRLERGRGGDNRERQQVLMPSWALGTKGSERGAVFNRYMQVVRVFSI